jgi:osomolarity two-component system, response regulator SKN7
MNDLKVIAPDFVKKLYLIIEDSTYNDYIIWSTSGDSIIVKDPNEFSIKVLPLHFKHNKFASFVRQLNKHNFHRVKNPALQDQECEFKHPNFQRGKKELLEQISRQQSSESALDVQKFDKQVQDLEQNQKVSFYQLKELERKIDFFERELSTCRMIVDSQSRVISDLMYSLPEHVRKMPELQQMHNDHQWKPHRKTNLT